MAKKVIKKTPIEIEITSHPEKRAFRQSDFDSLRELLNHLCTTMRGKKGIFKMSFQESKKVQKKEVMKK